MPASSKTDPSDYYFVVTKSDTVDCERGFRSLRIGTAGDGTLVVVRNDGTAVPFVGVKAGETLPTEGRRVNATGSGASDIVAYA